MKALLHVHSSFSYDGVPTPEELAEWGAARGLDAIFLSEHANDFDEAKMAELVRECGRLATRRCVLIPGLEYAVRGGFHVLAYHVRAFEPHADLDALSRFVRRQGGLVVLAHPARYRDRWPAGDTLRAFDGIEVWNARYDGRFLPPGHLLARFARARREAGSLARFGGEDLHELTDHRLVTTDVGGTNALGELVEALRRGAATFGSGGFAIPAGSAGRSLSLRVAGAAHLGYRAARRLRNRMVRSSVR